MAERPKRTLRTPDRLAYNSSAVSPKSKKNPRKDNALYEIEVKEVDRVKSLVRIHYKGYSDSYDEWRPYGSINCEEYFPFVRQEKAPVISKESILERCEMFTSSLYREVKRKLYSSRKDDPNVRIEIDVQEDVYDNVLGSLTNSIKERGRLAHYLHSNRLLDDTLGIRWDKRIFNINDDFAYVIDGSVKFWLGKKSPIVEYEVVGNGKLLTSVIEDTTQVVFRFVRADGNKQQYEITN